MPTSPYPILGQFGEQGSAKSTQMRMIRWIVDPVEADTRSFSNLSDKDLLAFATNNWVLALDNASWISARMSDKLCCLATGTAMGQRALYTDADEFTWRGARPILINGINNPITRGDLADRAIVLDLPRIDDNRRTEEQVWSEFKRLHPVLLGALCNAVSRALKRMPDIDLPNPPRMADFATFVEAAAPALGWQDCEFADLYRHNCHTVSAELGYDNPLVQAIRGFLLDAGEFRGTSSELMSALNSYQKIRDLDSRTEGWPSTPAKLGKALKRIAPTLRAYEVRVRFERTAAKREIYLALNAA